MIEKILNFHEITDEHRKINELIEAVNTQEEAIKELMEKSVENEDYRRRLSKMITPPNN